MLLTLINVITSAWAVKRKRLNFDRKIFKNSKETILGIIIDNKFIFYNHVNGLSKRVSETLSALSKNSPYLDSSLIDCSEK